MKFRHITLFLTLTTSLTFWEDYTCLDATQCMLNKAILDVAAKHVESNISNYQSQFLTLGTKVLFSVSTGEVWLFREYFMLS